MPRLGRPEAGRRPRPLFAKIELKEAWEAIQQVQRLGAPGLGLAAETLRAKLPFLQPRSSPDRSKLSSVESFFKYTEEEGAWPPHARGAAAAATAGLRLLWAAPLPRAWLSRRLRSQASASSRSWTATTTGA